MKNTVPTESNRCFGLVISQREQGSKVTSYVKEVTGDQEGRNLLGDANDFKRGKIEK